MRAASLLSSAKYFAPLMVLGALLSLLWCGLMVSPNKENINVESPLSELSLSEPLPQMPEAKIKQFESLLKAFRCVSCQNQSLADSNVPVALVIKKIIYLKLSEGQSEAQIKEYLAGQYGDTILYSPPFKKQTVVLWFAPGIFFMLACLLCWRVLLPNRKS